MAMINKIAIFSYILFAFSVIILYLNKVVAIMVLTASFGIFLLGGLLHARNDSANKNCKRKKETS